MTSQSSTKTLADIPAGTRVFIDANIFIYHFTQTPPTPACTALLQRVEAGSLQGITSVVAITEVAHRLMILEAIQIHQLASRTAVRKLKENSTLVQKLSLQSLSLTDVASNDTDLATIPGITSWQPQV